MQKDHNNKIDEKSFLQSIYVHICKLNGWKWSDIVENRKDMYRSKENSLDYRSSQENLSIAIALSVTMAASPIQIFKSMQHKWTWVKFEWKLSEPDFVSSRVRSAGPTVHLPSSGSSNGSFGLENVFLLGAFGVVHLLDLWNIRHIALRSLMGAWLFKTPVGPQAHYLNPLQFYTVKKEKAELGSVV